ncbi:uncharacterized protein LOC121388799 [Gigantopelta aegis]|uniref:uncharacterized protein LOC121388799 n=1 Tax=Gigantopelta aegis TaxID=1735272 RepID=UPI001B88C295|nr:uncharacterized protein LOC121388799 [Gigantopelta aegis]XP_041376237.1 uncharacterized protein LOC121388799 [Gigantopelta aegis]
MASPDGDHEDDYSTIIDSSIKLNTSIGKEPTYARYTITMTSNSIADKKTDAGYWSWKRCLVLLVAVLVVVSLVSASVVVTIYVVRADVSKLTESPTLFTTPKESTVKWTSLTSTTSTTISTTAISTSLTKTMPGNCSKSKLCHVCSSHDTRGRCQANGTVQYSSTKTCSMACFAQVRADDYNYVFRGCLSDQLEAVIKAAQTAVGCFEVENFIGAGLSTYCLCCDELCNTQDMTIYGGKDCLTSSLC